MYTTFSSNGAGLALFSLAVVLLNLKPICEGVPVGGHHYFGRRQTSIVKTNTNARGC